MSSEQIPKTDSLEELARFWGSHELTDFEDQLEEVTEPVFERRAERPSSFAWSRKRPGRPGSDGI